MSLGPRLRSEARDLLELVLVPGLAAILPWRLCFRLFRRFCRYDFLYREPVQEALEQARQRGWVRGDEAEWLRRRRLVTLVDHADFYLARTRSDQWMVRHLSVSGEWPDPGRAAILCTFHWGAGMWGLRHAASRGLHASAVVAAQQREEFQGHAIRGWYYRARTREVALALGRPPIEVSRSPRQIMRVLRSGEQVVAAIDVPSDQVTASDPIDFLGLRARVPRGLLRVAVDLRLPVVVFLTGMQVQDGTRTLRIFPLREPNGVEPLMRDAFAYLESAIEADPAAWHFWAVAPRFFDELPE